MRIANGEYDWPSVSTTAEANGFPNEQPEQLRGVALSTSDGLRGIVDKLLVRDPKKRTKIIDLWEDEWMRGEGAPLPPPPSTPQDEAAQQLRAKESSDSDLTLPQDVFSRDYVEPSPTSSHQHTLPTDVYSDCIDAFDTDGFEDEFVDVDDGVLVDGHDIGPGSVARQEH